VAFHGGGFRDHGFRGPIKEMRGYERTQIVAGTNFIRAPLPPGIQAPLVGSSMRPALMRKAAVIHARGIRARLSA
jgi:hypothetical protein